MAHGAWRTAAGGRVRLARRAGGAGRGGGALACSPPEACRDVGSGQYGTTAQHIIKTSVHSRTSCGRRDGCVQRGRNYFLCIGTWAGDEPTSRARSGGGDGVRTRGAPGGGAGRGGGALACSPPEACRDVGSGQYGTTAQHIIKTSVHSRTSCGRRDGCVQRGRIYSLCIGTWAGEEQPMSRAQSGGGDGVRTRGARGGGWGGGARPHGCGHCPWGRHV